MNQHRPRMTDEEYEVYIKRTKRENNYRIAIISDLHGIFIHTGAYSAFLNICKENEFDEVIINGDLLDLPLLSRHSRRLYASGEMEGYTEEHEIELVNQHVLMPLYCEKNVKQVRIRLGNHDERITKPFALGTFQMERLLLLNKLYNTTELDNMLMKHEKRIYDDYPVTSLFDSFVLVHGVSLAKNGPERNLHTYMTSGSSGHSHRLHNKYVNTYAGDRFWIESGCMRMKDDVEYLPTGNVADWMLGFAVVDFVLDKEVKMYPQTYAYFNNGFFYNGVHYNA